MPGVVKKIQCEEGDSVAEGTIIVTLEAMKMQNPLFAPMTGIVSGGRGGGGGGGGGREEGRASGEIWYTTIIYVIVVNIR